MATLLMAVVVPALSAQAPSPTKNPSPEVLKLVIRGVKNVNKHDLELSVATQASRCRSFLLEPFCLFSKSPILVEKHYLDHNDLRLDVLRMRVYYWRAGYPEATGDTAGSPRGEGGAGAVDVHEGGPAIRAAARIAYGTAIHNAQQRH